MGIPDHLKKQFQKPDERKEVQLTDRDRKIMWWTWKLRFCTTDHLRVVLDIPRYKEGEDKTHPRYRSLQRRLRQLWIASYLVRPPEQIPAKLKHPEIKYLVYGIGTRAAKELGKQGENVGKVSWTRKNKLVRSPFIAHQLASTDFHVAAALATGKADNLSKFRWYNEGRINDTFYKNGKERKIKPDAYLTFEVPSGRMDFCIEADMGTVSNRKMAKRFGLYSYWWRRDFHRRVGIGKNFRVLILCSTQARADNLIDLAGRKLDKGLNLFWFASQKDYDYKNPESIFKKIFTTPKGEASRSILKEHV